MASKTIYKSWNKIALPLIFFFFIQLLYLFVLHENASTDLTLRELTTRIVYCVLCCSRRCRSAVTLIALNCCCRWIFFSFVVQFDIHCLLRSIRLVISSFRCLFFSHLQCIFFYILSMHMNINSAFIFIIYSSFPVSQFNSKLNQKRNFSC